MCCQTFPLDGKLPPQPYSQAGLLQYRRNTQILKVDADEFIFPEHYFSLNDSGF